MYTNLLNRQIKRYLKEGTLITPEWEEFLKAVNNSYEHYERDHFLGKQSLEISSGELKQLIAEIADKETRIRAILGATPDGLIVINEKQEIELCNQSAATILGFAEMKELIGLNASMFKFSTPEQFWEDDFPTISSLSDVFAVKDHNILYQLSIAQKNGTHLYVELSISELKLRGDKKVVICLLRDISLRKQIESKIRLRHEITRKLLEAFNIQDVIPNVLSTLCVSLDWDIAFLYLRETPEGNIKPLFSSDVKAIPDLKEFKEKIFKTSLSEDDENNIIQKCIGDPQYIVNNIKDPSIKELANQFGLQSYISFPIFFKDKLFGLIEFYSRKNRVHDEQLIKILHDICSEMYMFLERQEAQHREHDLQRQLLIAARQAGMMQVATSVLHNVGNILNSVNTSAHIIQESVFSQGFEHFIKVAALIKKHKDSFATFILHDERGKNLPEYLFALSDWVQVEQQKLRSELKQLITNINDIKNVIKRQQNMSFVIGNKEKFPICKLLDDILAMKSKQLSSLEIQVEHDYRSFAELELDRVMLFQILENLIGNAIDSLRKSECQRKLIVQTECDDDHILNVRIIDNGGGIEEKNLESIFSFGFTTKGVEGHGYGLHSSAILAKEMGGKLSVKSDGIGTGATFTLKIPLPVNSNLTKVL